MQYISFCYKFDVAQITIKRRLIIIEMNDIRKIFKKNELKSYKIFPKERKISFIFANDHTLTIEIDGHPGINYDWDESVVVKIDGKLIAST